MRQLPNFVRLLICSLLIGGYGAMYAGSVLHELCHTVQASHSSHGDHAEAERDASASDDHNDNGCDHSASTIREASEPHSDVACFFCTHSPVISADLVVEQTWTPAVASLAPPAERTLGVHSSAHFFPSLRGPPTA
jgi:hypothetical protein